MCRSEQEKETVNIPELFTEGLVAMVKVSMRLMISVFKCMRVRTSHSSLTFLRVEEKDFVITLSLCVCDRDATLSSTCLCISSSSPSLLSMFFLLHARVFEQRNNIYMKSP